MKITLEKHGVNVVELGLELEAEKALKAYEQTCRSLSHKVKIPGFRPGKAPRRVLETTLGVDYIKSEALETLLPKILGEAITKENLDIITQPEINKCDFELGKPLQLQAKFEVRPPVEISNYTGLEISVTETKVPDDALPQMLDNIVQSKASFKNIPDKVIAMGDNVLLDFECFVEGNLIEGGSAKDLPVEVKSGNFIDNFCEQLVGHKNAEKFEINVKFPENYRNKEVAGKDAVFKIEVKEVRDKVVPEVDDELAKMVGFESLEELKKVLNERLEQEAKNATMSEAQKKVVEAVVELAKVEIPDSMVDREYELLLEQVKNYYESNKQDFEAFKQSPEFEAISNQKKSEAKKRVLTSLVLGTIVREQKLTISEEELTPFYIELMQNYNLSPKDFGNENLRRQIMEEALTAKVIKYLVDNSKLTYVAE